MKISIDIGNDETLSSGVILCMKCQSSHIDVSHWVDSGAVTACASCGSKGFIVGLSIGRVDLSTEQVNRANKDMAKPRYVHRRV